MKNRLLFDTNIVSYLYKNDTRAADYLPLVKGRTPFIAMMTLAELYRWPVQREWSESRKAALEAWLRRRFSLLPMDPALARTWAVLVGKTCRDRPISTLDSWIAATAIHHGLPLVTHNRRHFESIPGLQIISQA